MTDTAVRMTPQQHVNLAAALAERVLTTTTVASERPDGIPPFAHEALFREMHALAALAQVHATLAVAGLETAVDAGGNDASA